MSIVQFSLRRPYTILVVVVAMLGGAVLGLRAMPRDILPPLGVPTIYVAQPFGGMDPAQMEGFLTYYYEYHFLYITGIEHVESKSIQGAALIKLQFYPGTDMSQAMSETVSYVNRARAFMPPGTVPPFVMRFDAFSTVRNSEAGVTLADRKRPGSPATYHILEAVLAAALHRRAYIQVRRDIEGVKAVRVDDPQGDRLWRAFGHHHVVTQRLGQLVKQPGPVDLLGPGSGSLSRSSSAEPLAGRSSVWSMWASATRTRSAGEVTWRSLSNLWA